MRRFLFAALLLLGPSGLIASAHAQVSVSSGKIIAIFGDPDDFVVQLDTNGRCGSDFFHIQRAKAFNFKEMTAIALTAFTTGKTMSFFVVSCVGEIPAGRNITSHGFVSR